MGKLHQILLTDDLSLLDERLVTHHEQRKSQWHHLALRSVLPQKLLHAHANHLPQNGYAPLHDGHKSVRHEFQALIQQC